MEQMELTGLGGSEMPMPSLTKGCAPKKAKPSIMLFLLDRFLLLYMRTVGYGTRRVTRPLPGLSVLQDIGLNQSHQYLKNARKHTRRSLLGKPYPSKSVSEGLQRYSSVSDEKYVERYYSQKGKEEVTDNVVGICQSTAQSPARYW